MLDCAHTLAGSLAHHHLAHHQPQTVPACRSRPDKHLVSLDRRLHPMCVQPLTQHPEVGGGNARREEVRTPRGHGVPDRPGSVRLEEFDPAVTETARGPAGAQRLDTIIAHDACTEQITPGTDGACGIGNCKLDAIDHGEHGQLKHEHVGFGFFGRTRMQVRRHLAPKEPFGPSGMPAPGHAVSAGRRTG